MGKSSIITLLKGLIIGGTMLVPGVSGGSMAMILGIYNHLISAVSSFTRNKKANALFLGCFVTGAGIGMILFANPLLRLIETYPKPMLYFFLGAVAGGIPMIYKEAQVKSFSLDQLVHILIGLCVVMLFLILPSDLFQANLDNGLSGYVYLIVAGFIAAVALVLPGISVSYLLLVIGLYNQTMEAIRAVDILFLMPLAVGIVLGIFLTTKMLEKAMTRYPQITYLIILGFVLGSLIETFPGMPKGAEWVVCVITAGIGFVLLMRLTIFEKNQL